MQFSHKLLLSVLFGSFVGIFIGSCLATWKFDTLFKEPEVSDRIFLWKPKHIKDHSLLRELAESKVKTLKSKENFKDILKPPQVQLKPEENLSYVPRNDEVDNFLNWCNAFYVTYGNHSSSINSDYQNCIVPLNNFLYMSHYLHVVPFDFSLDMDFEKKMICNEFLNSTKVFPLDWQKIEKCTLSIPRARMPDSSENQ